MTVEESTAVISVGSLPHERLGPIWVAISPRGLVGLHMRADEASVRAYYSGNAVEVAPSRVASLLAQLASYFEGRQRAFEIEVDWSVLTPFQQRVLQRVQDIPYGQTRTYHDIALDLGSPGAARAVGRANATNPMPIIIPCHRVLGADGKLHGYGGAGGVETKAWLLQLEGSRLL